MVPLEERTVVHVLQRGARECPTRVAVRDETTQATYAELLDRSARVGAGLRGLGVGRDDTVVLMLDNNLDHVVAWFAASWIGAVEVPVNTASMPPQLRFIADDCEATVMVIEGGYLDRVRAVAGEFAHLRHLVVRGDCGPTDDLPFQVHRLDALARSAPVEPVRLAPGDLCGIVYTSGTTGQPKGVMVTHAQTYGRNGPLGVGSPRQGDVSLIALPIFHVIGQCRGLYNTLIALGTAVLVERFSASRFWQTCREHQVTYACLVGVMAEYLLAQPARPDDADHGVERIALGTTIRDVDAFARRFGVWELHVSYGLTEAGGVLVGPARSEGCGQLREDFRARLVDGNDREVPDGEVGELVLRPTEPWTTMLGYWRRPEETLAKWRNLWLHTGDLMRRDAAGTYYFAGRLSDRIRYKGENISPAAVEGQLLEHPMVAECSVVGVEPSTPMAAGDQEILAVVVPRSGQCPSPVDLVEFLAGRLPHFSVPRYVRFAERLPRTESTRRVQRNVLAAQGIADSWDRLAAGVVVGRDGAVTRTVPTDAPLPHRSGRDPIVSPEV